MCTTTDLEAAIADLGRAVALAPDDATMPTLLAQWTRELKAQNKKDRALLSGAFEMGQLYSDAEAAQVKASIPCGADASHMCLQVP